MDTAQKNNTLKTLAELLIKNKQDIIAANKQDISANSDGDAAMLERLEITENKILGMVAALNKIEKSDDPQGRILCSHTHDNGLKIENKTVPFGKVFIIYESRPDVTVEAAAVAFKAGNKVLLKGGKEACLTNLFLVKLWQEALVVNKLDKDCVEYLDLNREQTQDLIKNNTRNVDLIIPRGGDGLINFVTGNTTIPTIVSGRGNNFLYVDSEADFEMAIKIILNGKQRLSVCNALDKVLINENLPDIKIKVSNLIDDLIKSKIEVWGDKKINGFDSRAQEIFDDKLFQEEFLSAKMLLSAVKNIDEAISLINKYSGGHSASIITANTETAAGRFQNEIDCAAVYHNASTQFTDGGQFGFGAEIAISTQKLHARGPIGINQLVTNKWFIYGNGQTRI